MDAAAVERATTARQEGGVFPVRAPCDAPIRIVFGHGGRGRRGSREPYQDEEGCKKQDAEKDEEYYFFHLLKKK